MNQNMKDVMLHQYLACLTVQWGLCLSKEYLPLLIGNPDVFLVQKTNNMDLSPNNNVSVKRRAADIEELEKKFAQADSSITRSIERTEIGYLKSTHSQSKKLSMDLKKENISTDSRKPRPQSAENNKKRRLVESETEAIPILCLYSRYLQFHRLLFNIQSKFEIAETQAKKDLAIGYEAVKRKEEAVQKQTLEEEDKENSVKCYLSKLKGVLKQVNQRLENDQEIDYERGVLSDMLIELKDIKIPNCNLREDIRMLMKYREIIQNIIDS